MLDGGWKRQWESQLLKVSFYGRVEWGPNARITGPLSRKPVGIRRPQQCSLQGIKVMRVSWLDTTFHITVTNIKSIRGRELIRAVSPPLFARDRETRVKTPLISTALVQRVVTRSFRSIQRAFDYFFGESSKTR